MVQQRSMLFVPIKWLPQITPVNRPWNTSWSSVQPSSLFAVYRTPASYRRILWKEIKSSKMYEVLAPLLTSYNNLDAVVTIRYGYKRTDAASPGVGL